MMSQEDQLYWTHQQAVARQKALMGLGQVPRPSDGDDKVKSVEFYPWLKGLCDTTLKRQSGLWAANYNLWTKNCLYYLSIMNLSRSGSRFGFKVNQKDHRLYPFNMFRPNLEEALAALMEGAPAVRFMALDLEERRSSHIVREIEVLHQYLMFKYFTEEMKMRTMLDGMICGNRHFQVWYDEDSTDGVSYAQQYRDLRMDGGIKARCYECGLDSEADAGTESCPECGSSSVALRKEDPEEFTIPGQPELQHAGEIVLKDWSPLQCRYDLTTGPEASPFFYIEEDLPREVIEERYNEKVEDNSASETWAQDEQMHPIRAVRRAESERNVAGFSTPGEFNEILEQQFFFEPAVLHWVKLSKPEVLPDGTKIPAGVRLSEAFKAGMNAVKTPGASKFMAITDRSHKRLLVHGKHMVALGRADGVGNRDSARYNFQENILRSGMYRYLQKTLQPSVAAVQSVFPQRDLFNRPDGVIHVSASQVGDNPLSNYFAHVVPPPLPNDLYEMIVKLQSDSRESWKAYTSESDGFSEKNPTARAAVLSAERRAASFGLNLTLYGGTIKEVAVRQIEWAQEKYETMRVIAARDELTNTWRSKQLKAEDLRCSVVAYVVPGTSSANYKSEKIEKFAQAITLTGELAKLGLLNPAVLQQVNQLTGVDLTFSNQFEHVEQAERVYEAMKNVDTQTNGMTPAEALVMILPVKPNAPDHEVQRIWWSRLLGSNEAQSFSPELEKAVNLRIQEHDLAIAAMAQRQLMLTPQGASERGAQPPGENNGPQQ